MDDLISRQAAIDALDCINGVEEVLRALPSAQPEKRTEERTETHACDLISRRAAIDDAHKQIWYRMNQQGMRDRIDAWLKDLPSAQPEIIRCRDCKFWNPHYAECEGIGNWFGFEGAWSADGYCYKAERREE